ncbi:MAG: RNA polymerase sigma factor [Candidatus Omnitrophota bacterium]
MDPELRLIERARNGDREAFNLLVDLYRERAFSVAFGFTGNTEDAKDALQEAFVKAYISIINFRGSSSFYTWFYRILVNQCKDLLRKRGIIKRVFSASLPGPYGEEPAVEAVDTSRGPFDRVLDLETKRLIGEAVDKLPAKQKSVFILRHIEGMKMDEIARVVGCSESTVKVHLFRAVRGLRCRLTKSLSI